ncbi:CDP-glycerol glycerophosphotransferase family protein [Arthrobacter mobilis]|uniref:CDP-glycerol glycerophosphotransferase n=1 Tax=Arthrobacter mobilis TaxID=2724944 RepID=A0A7X6K7C5_9MICC|nr:CDP-glycerol glycerophosphotransferase family protein [Arthrobacter mobilis]NKX56497.1 CDP-glycerol glycerophosphotransferase [Arthrobacter mobilis]
MPNPKSLLTRAKTRTERVLDPRSSAARRELHHLAVGQRGTVLTAGFTLAPELTPLALWAAAGGDALRLVPVDAVTGEETPHGRNFQAELPLEPLAARVPAAASGGEGAVLQLFLEVEAEAARLPRYSRGIRPAPQPGEPAADTAVVDAGDDFASFRTGLEAGRIGPALRYRAWLPLGRFLETTIGPLAPVAAGTSTLTPYVNRRGYLSLAVDRPLKPYNAIYVKKLSVAGGLLELTGRLVTRHGDAVRAQLVLLGRQTGRRYTAPAHLVFNAEATSRHYGLREYSVEATLDFSGIPTHELAEEDIVDLWLEVWDRVAAEPHKARIGRTRYVTRKLTRAGWQRRGDQTVCITPYYTFKAKNTSFHIEVIDTDAFDYLQQRTRIPLRNQRGLTGKPVWLVGERPYKAQDTGLAFFRYLRLNHPEIDAYYVMDPASPEARNLEGLGNVVAYRSREHFEVALKAERFIGSHHPDFLYPTRLPQFRRAAGGVKVFLQHGVMGTKWMVPNYGKKAPDFETDLFLVSSEREKEYIVSDFGYAPKDVKITGLSRFDTLFAGDVEVRRNQILVIPTWRDWLPDPALFTESEYYHAWKSFLTDPRLRRLSEEHQAEIVFCLHPNMQQFRHHFADAPVRVISQGEVDVQHLLKESALLVTDYSSVGFDFSFLDKPVLYYQFDRERFLGPQGSHLELDEELPGKIAFDRQRLLANLEEALASGCAMPPEYTRRARRFLKYRDQDNCRRIFEAVRAAKPAEPRVRRMVDPELGEKVAGRFRRSRYYFPAMQRMFKLVARTPMDKDLIVFESGLGKQYADSPRYIYEELLRRGDTRRKVWVYDRKLPVADPHTKVVKRLSPEYYWYLARAKYWVNNQNFPHYLRRRKDGVYIQTWHGTPLKRMLHDMDEVHGRTDGYIERVSQAVRQWSVLLSPSPYATAAFRSAFRYQGPVLEEGYPRNDVLALGKDTGAGRAVRAKLGIPADRKVVLYAPTFRDDQATGTGRFSFELPLDLERFHKRFGEDTVLLLRMHVLVAGRLSIPESASETVFDVSAYPEIQDLHLASDVLVTDYSSVFFDFAILQRPIIFYAYDLERYRDTLRGFYLDYGTDLPGPVVQTEEELFDAIEAAGGPDPDGRAKLAAFAAKYAPKDDGGAAGRVVDALL